MIEFQFATNIAIVRDSEVENIIWGFPYDMEQFVEAGVTAVPIDDLGVAIGDEYRDGKFYHDGEEVIPATDRLQNHFDDALSEIIDEIYASDEAFIEGE